ncbi:MAG: M48 family metallopeptidase [Pseudomonadota bacterium]
MAYLHAPVLTATYFDGASARGLAVSLQITDDALTITGEGIMRSVPVREIKWPERTRHGMRLAHFKSGGLVQAGDTAAWDDWIRASGITESVVVKMQQSWRWVFASVLLLGLLLVAFQQWGVPLAARAVVAITPQSVDRSLGETSLRVLDSQLLQATRLPAAEQQRLRLALAQAVSAMPPGTLPPWELVFRKSRIGPNAFALPGGTLVMTDELVELAGHDDDVVIAVLAHELGHVRNRHGLRMLVQTAALSGLAAMVVGDFSTVLAGVPVLLGQASYSRQAEHEADVDAVRILRAARISPGVMVKLFDRLVAIKGERGAGEKDNSAINERAGQSQDSWLGIAFASHPADADRIRYFQDAAGEQ